MPSKLRFSLFGAIVLLSIFSFIYIKVDAAHLSIENNITLVEPTQKTTTLLPEVELIEQVVDVIRLATSGK